MFPPTCVARVKIVIFTNQNGIAKGTTSAADIKGKILDIIKAVSASALTPICSPSSRTAVMLAALAVAWQAGVPMQAFVATDDDMYRKPGTGM